LQVATRVVIFEGSGGLADILCKLLRHRSTHEYEYNQPGASETFENAWSGFLTSCDIVCPRLPEKWRRDVFDVISHGHLISIIDATGNERSRQQRLAVEVFHSAMRVGSNHANLFKEPNVESDTSKLEDGLRRLFKAAMLHPNGMEWVDRLLMTFATTLEVLPSESLNGLILIGVQVLCACSRLVLASAPFYLFENFSA